MGTFRVEVQGVGNHGCERDKRNDAVVSGCGSPGCVDCITREYVAKLRAAGVSFSTTGTRDSVGYAQLTHWPGGHGTVYDGLLTGRRTNNF